MSFTFLSHFYKQFTRSSSFGKEMATKIFLGLIALMVVVYSLAFGFALEKILADGLKQSDTVGFLNGLLVYYFVFEFMMRYFLQSLPMMEVQPYLHLPVSKNKIAHFLLVRSLISVANIFVFLLFAPFALGAVAKQFGTLASYDWLLSLWLLSLTNHFAVVLFKKKLDDSVWGLLILIAVFGGLGAVDYFNWFKLSDISKLVFHAIIETPMGVGGMLLLALVMYAIDYRVYLHAFYPDEVSNKNVQRRQTDFGFLKHLGLTGEWMGVELKLILRNKRTKSIVFISLFFLLYGNSPAPRQVLLQLTSVSGLNYFYDFFL